MFKYLIPFLLATTLAYGQEINLDKLHNHFDPTSPSWDGGLQTVAPPIAQVAPLPVATPVLGNKCTTDDLKTVSTYLRSFGYRTLIMADDKSRDNVRDEIMYNVTDNSILSLSIFFDQPLSAQTEDHDITATKICTEFQAVKTDADGPTFKKLVLGIHMSEMTEIQKETDDHKRKLSSNQDDPHHEPYKGDPSRVGYQIP